LKHQSAEEHGRQLAERIIAQAQRYGLAPADVAVMVREDIERYSRAMEAEGVSSEEIAAWTDAVGRACRLRVEEERSRKK